MTGDYGFGVTTSAKKTPFFEAAFKVIAAVDPVNKTETAVEQQYVRKVTIYLTEKTKPYAMDQLKALGWDGSSLTRLDRNKPGYQDLEGNEFLGYVKHEPKDDKVYENWNISTGEPKGGKVKIANQENVADDLDALFDLSPSVTTVPVTTAAEDEFKF